MADHDFRWSRFDCREEKMSRFLIVAIASALAGSVATVVLLLGTGLLYFRRMERTFADVI